MGKGRQISLEQRPRAEEDPAVAAASVLARAEFITRLDALSRNEGFPFPKGASEKVIQAAIALYRGKGKEGLARAAKLHFKTTQAVLGK